MDPSLFRHVLQRIAYYAYGPKLTQRLALLSKGNSTHAKCSACNAIEVATAGVICNLCTSNGGTTFMVQFDAHPFYELIGKYLIALRFPHKWYALCDGIRGTTFLKCNMCMTRGIRSFDTGDETGCSKCESDRRRAWCDDDWCIAPRYRCTMCSDMFCVDHGIRCYMCDDAVCFRCLQTFGCWTCVSIINYYRDDALSFNCHPYGLCFTHAPTRTLSAGYFHGRRGLVCKDHLK